MDNNTFTMNAAWQPEQEVAHESFECTLLPQNGEALLLCDASPSFFGRFRVGEECRGEDIFPLLRRELGFLTDLSAAGMPEGTLRCFAELNEAEGTSFWEIALDNAPPFLHLSAQQSSAREIALHHCGENSVDLASFYAPDCLSMFLEQDSGGAFRLVSGNGAARRRYDFPCCVTCDTFGRLTFLRSTRIISCAEQHKSLLFYDIVHDDAGTGCRFVRILCLPVERESGRLFLLLAAPCTAEDFFARCTGGEQKQESFEHCPYAVATFSFFGGDPVLEGFNRCCEKLMRQGVSVAELLNSEAVTESAHRGVPCTGQEQLKAGVYEVSALPTLWENGVGRMMVTIVPSRETEPEAEPEIERQAPAETEECLTPREQETLSLASQGYPNRYIARRMEISEGTVKKLLYNVYRKLGVSSRVELCRMLQPQTAMG